MTNKLEISRELAERIQRLLFGSMFEFVETGEKALGMAEELRALLDATVAHQHEWDINNDGTATVCSVCGIRSSDDLAAPVVERQEPVPDYFVQACDKFDWTPEEALKFYAEGKHFDTENGRTRILCSGAIASYALKNLNGDYAKLKGAEQPAPVAVAPDDWLTLDHQFQEVGLAYWNAHQLERGDGAVKFLHNDETGALFVVTRGEYSQELKDFIFSLDKVKELNP